MFLTQTAPTRTYSRPYLEKHDLLAHPQPRRRHANGRMSMSQQGTTQIQHFGVEESMMSLMMKTSTNPPSHAAGLKGLEETNIAIENCHE